MGRNDSSAHIKLIQCVLAYYQIHFGVVYAMLITEMTVYLLGKQAEMKEDGWGTGLLCNI